MKCVCVCVCVRACMHGGREGNGGFTMCHGSWCGFLDDGMLQPLEFMEESVKAWKIVAEEVRDG